MLAYAEVPIGGRPAACARCRPCPEEAPFIPAEEVASAIRRDVQARGGSVALVGGDAFEHPAWRDLVSGALVAGARRLRTDAGPALAVYAEEALCVGVRHVRVRLLAPPSRHDELLRAAGAGEATLAGVRAFLDAAERAGVSAVVTAILPVCRHNLHDLPATVTALAETGAASAEAVLDTASVPPGPAAPWLAAAADSGTVNRMWLRLAGVTEGALPGYEMHFEPPFATGEPA
ncbi:MAG: hypothetical protein IBX62_02540 [Coriobacteriia bacterium]|nr:hypothetical protein [Coriobacteriia bacterium]